MTLYLDTSSLVKLSIAEPGSELVRELVNQAVVVALEEHGDTRLDHQLMDRQFPARPGCRKQDVAVPILAAPTGTVITLGISETNTSYLNSGIAQRLRLVHSQQVSYSEHDDLGQDLHALSNHNGITPISTPLGDLAALFRDVHGADLVMLVTEPTNPNSCGIAWKMSTHTP